MVVLGLVLLLFVHSSSTWAQRASDTLSPYTHAIELIANGEYASALTLLEGNLAPDASHHRLQYLIGVCRFYLGDYYESVRALEAAFQGDSTSFACCLALGKAYVALNLLPAARQMFERAMHLEGGSLAARFELVRILCMQKQWDDLRALLSTNLTVAELLVIGRAHLNTGRSAQALEYATKAIAKDSTSFSPRLLLADALFATQQYDAAFVKYAELILENQNSAPVARKLAFCYERQGSRGVPVAILMMQKYMRLTGDTTAADLARIGSWFYALQRYDSSAAYYGLAAARDSTSAEVRFNYGLALFRLGKLREAERELRTAEQLSASTRVFQASIAMTLAAVLLERKATVGALQYYRKALRFDPTNKEALFGLAVSYDRAGNAAQAIRWYRKFLGGAHTRRSGDGLVAKAEARLKELGRTAAKH